MRLKPEQLSEMRGRYLPHAMLVNEHGHADKMKASDINEVLIKLNTIVSAINNKPYPLLRIYVDGQQILKEDLIESLQSVIDQLKEKA